MRRLLVWRTSLLAAMTTWPRFAATGGASATPQEPSPVPNKPSPEPLKSAEQPSPKLEELANAYTQLSLKEITQLQRLIFRKLDHSEDFYEKALLRVLGGGGGGGGGFVAAPLAASALPQPAAEPAAAPEKTEKKPKIEKTMFDVHLMKYDQPQKIQLIKALRTVVQLPMKEAKDTIDKAPGLIAKALGRDDAEKLKAEMEKHGAEVKLL